MTHEIEADYLIVGAGATAMAFADELLQHSKATIAIVDRRHAPGGHWVDAYPFVRLHQPSTFYGVSSVPLGSDAMDTSGTNKGFYELAGADELRAYYQQVMFRHFLPTGRVRCFPSSEHTGDGRFVSRLSGESWKVTVRRKIVDTTYLEGTIPATSPPPFEVAEGARCVPAGAITRLEARPERFVIVGAGKTALDVLGWLLEQGVPASALCWIKPREAWWINRRFEQPHTLSPDLYRGVAIQLEAMAEATSVDDLFARLEEKSFFLRVDPKVKPSMFRGAIVSEGEIELLRQIENVVRLGHVRRIERDSILLDGGRIPTDERTVHVHCAASALVQPPKRPIFEKDRVTIQPYQWGFACYSAALLGVVEANIESDEEKNALCPPMLYWDKNEDYLSAFLATMIGDQSRSKHPALAPWIKTTRLNPANGLAAYRDRPDVKETRERIKRSGLPAAINAQTLLAHGSTAP
ncbi:MAG: NAD(P)-binding protein [Deltaproteobacteria bacterium]|nr:NAD(P)-binding protein [Deltaproteobacteria bacterium]